MEKVVVEACSSAQEFEIVEDLPIETQIYTLATKFSKTKEEATRIQLELNAQIIDLRL